MTSPSPATSKPPKHLLRWVLSLSVALLLGVAIACYFWFAPPNVPPSPLPPDGPPWFRDVTASSGIDFTCRTGEEADLYTILESLGSGVAMIDYDGDGLLDLFFAGGGYFVGKEIKGNPCKLYKNLGDWKFRDVTADAGLDKINFYTHGIAVADYDCDGWPDLLITGYGRLALFRNESDNGKRRYVDVTARAGIDDKLWSTSAGWADLTGSGFPDLYVCHYLDWSFANDPPCPGMSGVKRDVCGPLRFKPQPHALFRNQRDGTFRQAEPGTLRKDGFGLGVVLADVNADGRPDIYVANDAFDNFLYVNRGQGKLDEIGVKAGVARDDNGVYNNSMGVDAGDFDGSGRASLWVTNYQGENHALYLNEGRERFLYVTRTAGIAAIGQNDVGFGTAFLDFDNDGWEDLVIVNGHAMRHPVGAPAKQLPVLLHNLPNQGRRLFKNVTHQGGPYFQTPALGRGLAVGDLDNDGLPDVVVSHANSPAVLLQNQAAARQTQRWIGVKLTGRKARDLVGTTVTLDDGVRTFTRFVKGGGSYLSASDTRLHFGLGTTGICKRVTVRWSWGETQHWDDLESNGYWELREGDTKAARRK